MAPERQGLCKYALKMAGIGLNEECKHKPGALFGGLQTPQTQSPPCLSPPGSELAFNINELSFLPL